MPDDIRNDSSKATPPDAPADKSAEKTGSASPIMPTGRLRRLGKLAALGADISSRVAAKAVQRVVKGTSGEPRIDDRPKADLSDLTPEQRQARERMEKLLGEVGISVEMAEKLVSTLGEMKGVAMKFGQQISMEQDMLPPEVRAVVAKLYNDVQRMEYPMVAGVVESELGKTPDKLFAEFEQEAFAAASLGQVHRAVTRQGERVAVKVQYPGVDKALVNDLKNVGLMVKTIGLLANKSGDANLFFGEIANETENELDYRLEAQNNALLTEAVRSWSDLVVPRIVRELSSQRVLTMQFLEGETLRDWARRDHDDDARFRVAVQLVKAIYGPFFSHGLVHADPHPGNYLVLNDGRLAILDTGVVKKLPASFVAAYWQLAMGDLDRTRHIDIYKEVVASGFEVRIPEERARVVIDEIAKIIRMPIHSDDYDFGTYDLVRRMRTLGMTHTRDFMAIRPPPEALFFFRAVGGLTQNLGMMRARGDFRSVVRQIVDGPHLRESPFAMQYLR